jgi:hypothetical protein
MTRSVTRYVSLVTALALAVAAGSARAAGTDPARWRGDARFLVSAVDSLHPQPWRWHRRAAWDSAATELERRLPTMRYDQAVAGFSRLLAMLRDGHSRLDQLQLPSHGRPALAPLPGPGFDTKFPFECDVFADGVWITAAGASHPQLPGSHIVAVDGVPIASVLEALAPLIPADNPMWTLYMLSEFLRSPGYLCAAGLAEDPTAPIRLGLKDAHGKRREVELLPVRPDSSARWKAADANTRRALPLTRRLPGPFAFADLGDSARTVFARIRAIVDEPGGERMAEFVTRLFAHVDSLGARRLILDLRGNGGGNNYLNQPLVHALIRRPELDRTGRLFVVVDRGTFSAAVSLAADLERETHALFVGEPTGAAPNSPGDPTHVTLPASGLVVRISTVLWQGSDPRDPRAFIAPDLPAMPTWADWLAHRDPALAAIEAYRPPEHPADPPPNTRWGSREQLEAKLPRVAW